MVFDPAEVHGELAAGRGSGRARPGGRGHEDNGDELNKNDA